MKITDEELRLWIDDEGGLASLIQHGMNEEFEDPQTEQLWSLAVDAFNVFAFHMYRLHRKIKY